MKNSLILITFLILLSVSGFAFFHTGDKIIIIDDRNQTTQDINQNVLGGFYFPGASLTLSDQNFFNVNDANLALTFYTQTDANSQFVFSSIFNSSFNSDFNVNNVVRLLQDSSCDENTSCTITGDFNGTFNGLVPAFRVTSDGNGTFGAGNYVFPTNLTLSGSNAQLIGSDNADLNFQDGTFTQNLIVDTNTLCVIASNNRLGVNTCIPNHTLDVQGSDATVIRMLRRTNVAPSGAGITFDLLDSAGSAVPYARMQGIILDNTSGDQNGEYFFDVAEAGVFVQKLRLSPGSTVFNDDQRDVDFMIKTDSANHFVINAGLERTTIQGGVDGSSTMFIVRNFSGNNLFLTSNTQVVVNQDSLSTLNFRAESDNFTQALLVDSLNDLVHFDVNIDVDPGTGRGSVTINGSDGGCLIISDTDNLGDTFCTALNGVLSCSTTQC